MSKVAITGNASGTGVFTVASPNSNVDRVLTLPDESGTVITTATTLVPSTTNTAITLGTAVATTSGTSIDFTGIPAGVKRVTVMFKTISTNGTSPVQIQLGSGSVVTSGYESNAGYISNTSVLSSTYTTGLVVINGPSASFVNSGQIQLNLLGSNTWCEAGILMLATAANNALYSSSGAITLAGVIDRLRITTVNGTDAFDAGSVNISWEF